MSLVLEQLTVGYGHDARVVDELSLTLESGQIGCLLGASGCGKTTTLRAIAGFEPLRGGQIRVNGRLLSAVDVHRPPEQRGIGLVFQDHALFPHLTVQANIEFGIRAQADRARQSAEWIDWAGLHGLALRYPHELSGGQQQRVALARALAPNPAVLLMDEPLSSLDTGLRWQMARDLRARLRERGSTVLMVTHDQHEAFAMADRVGLMHRGRLLQWSSPNRLYHQPDSRIVADFTGHGSYLRAKLSRGRLDHALGHSPAPKHASSQGLNCVDLLIRPDHIRHDPAGYPARVRTRQCLGADILYELELSTEEIVTARWSSHQRHAAGEMVHIALVAHQPVVFEPIGADDQRGSGKSESTEG
ncbi:MAG: ABC transporter ATP-binding protein [Pseudomonadota bacterium]